jgi:transcriptional regulator with XRE-family HTH domain
MKFNRERQEYNRILDFIRGTMRRKKISQADIAYRLGLPQGAISKRLSGEVDWTLFEVLNVFEILGITFEYQEKEDA